MVVAPNGLDPTEKRHLVYDAWNRLVEVRADDAGDPGQPGALVVTYRYSGLGHRVTKLLGSDPENPATTIDYYYNAGWQVVEERRAVGAGSAQVHTQYLWCPSYIDTPVLRWRDTSEVPDQTLNETLYYTVDANKNVTGLITPNGQVVERYLYDPYGRVTVLDNDWNEIAWSASRKNEILFTGYRYNPETGYYQARNGEYHPTLGRFMQRDPLGYVDGGNLYAGYFVMWGGVDPMGLNGLSVEYGLRGAPSWLVRNSLFTGYVKTPIADAHVRNRWGEFMSDTGRKVQVEFWVDRHGDSYSKTTHFDADYETFGSKRGVPSALIANNGRNLNWSLCSVTRQFQHPDNCLIGVRELSCRHELGEVRTLYGLEPDTAAAIVHDAYGRITSLINPGAMSKAVARAQLVSKFGYTAVSSLQPGDIGTIWTMTAAVTVFQYGRCRDRSLAWDDCVKKSLPVQELFLRHTVEKITHMEKDTWFRGFNETPDEVMGRARGALEGLLLKMGPLFY